MGEEILTLAVLSILITAPLGAISILAFGPKLLENKPEEDITALAANLLEQLLDRAQVQEEDRTALRMALGGLVSRFPDKIQSVVDGEPLRGEAKTAGAEGRAVCFS